MFLENLFDVLFLQRLQIDVICVDLVRHDGGWIGIDQNDFNSFFPQ